MRISWVTLAEALRHGRTDLARRAVGARKRGEARLDRGKSALERVVIRIGYLGRVERVIGGIGRLKRCNQRRQLGRRLGFGQVLDRGFLAHVSCSPKACASL